MVSDFLLKYCTPLEGLANLLEAVCLFNAESASVLAEDGLILATFTICFIWPLGIGLCFLMSEFNFLRRLDEFDLRDFLLLESFGGLVMLWT